MAYIGPLPAETFTSFATQEFSTSATTSYTLDHAVTNENEIALFINNVRQQPGSGKAYTASGTALTLSAATASTDTMYAVFLGRALQTVNPADASVGTSQLAATSVTAAKLNTDIISGQTALAETPADTDELLLSDGGTIKRIDFSHIKSTPTHVLLSTTNVTSGVSSIDITSNIDSTYKKYMIDILNLHPANDGEDVRIRFYQSGSFVTGSSDYRSIQQRHTDGVQNQSTQQAPGNSMKALHDIGGNEANEHANARFFLNDPSNTTFRTTIGGVGQTIRSNGEIQTHTFAGLIENTTAVTGFQLFMGNGNIDNAIVKLYGVS